MTSHISELQCNIVTRISAGGSLRKEQTIHPLARFTYFEGMNNPWEQRKESNLLLKDNETRDLTVCPLCYVVAGTGYDPVTFW